MVEGGAPGDPAEPGARARAARVVTPPPAERALERLAGEVLRRGAVPRQEDQVAVDGVEVQVGDLGERPLHARLDRGRHCVHVSLYAAAAALVTTGRLTAPVALPTLHPFRRLQRRCVDMTIAARSARRPTAPTS